MALDTKKEKEKRNIHACQIKKIVPYCFLHKNGNCPYFTVFRGGDISPALRTAQLITGISTNHAEQLGDGITDIDFTVVDKKVV